MVEIVMIVLFFCIWQLYLSGFYWANKVIKAHHPPSQPSLSIPAPHFPSFLSLWDEYIKFLVGDWIIIWWQCFCFSPLLTFLSTLAHVFCWALLVRISIAWNVDCSVCCIAEGFNYFTRAVWWRHDWRMHSFLHCLSEPILSQPPPGVVNRSKRIQKEVKEAEAKTTNSGLRGGTGYAIHSFWSILHCNACEGSGAISGNAARRKWHVSQGSRDAV